MSGESWVCGAGGAGGPGAVGAEVAVVVNPVAGVWRAGTGGAARVALARRLLEAAGVAGTVRVTRGPGDAAALARAAVARGAALVVAWGGDGTVNEVAGVLAGQPAALGIVPAGSGNGLARALGLPRRPAAALRVALSGPERRVDVGELGGHRFVNVAGVGFDAHVAARFNARPAGRRGPAPYFALVAREVFRYRPRTYRLRLEDESLELAALLIAWANAPRYGGLAQIAPDARPDDGVLDLVAVAARAPLRLLWEARRLFWGGLRDAPGVFRRRCRTLEVAGEPPLAFHVDGEPLAGGGLLRGRVHAGALRVRVPA